MSRFSIGTLAPSLKTVVPWMEMRPVSGFSRPAMLRRQVVLPQPEGPSSVKNSPRPTERETPFKAWWDRSPDR